jgi:hypothetical protein
MGTEIDCLVLEDYVLIKEDQPARLLQDPEQYQREYVLD